MKRAVQIAVDKECDTMLSEFNGRPENPSISTATFHRSMEELLPIFEREGIRLTLKRDPDDFTEAATSRSTRYVA